MAHKLVKSTCKTEVAGDMNFCPKFDGQSAIVTLEITSKE